MNLVVYGDLHGCLNEFKALRKKVKLKKNDIEIVVGDILNKGPYNLETLRYIIKNKILSVRGNNEDKILKLFSMYKEDDTILEDIKPWEAHILKNIKKSEIKFLKSLPYFIKIKGITIVHGGIPQGIKLKKLSKEDKKQLTLLRFYDKKFHPIPWHDFEGRYKFWSEVYNGREGFVVFGHHPFEKPKVEKFAIGIDTGCVYGGELTAIKFNNLNVKDYDFISLKARKKYFK